MHDACAMFYKTVNNEHTPKREDAFKQNNKNMEIKNGRCIFDSLIVDVYECCNRAHFRQHYCDIKHDIEHCVCMFIVRV